MNTPLVSILVANYNNGNFFKDCYQSIIDQTYDNWEVIIVDDASTDNSVLVIKQIIGEDNRFKIFMNDKNKGCGYTKNKCALMANGEILGFLDPDDALKLTALELMVDLHIKNQGVAIITSKYDLVDLDMNFIKSTIHGNIVPLDKSYLTYGMGALTHFATFKQYKYKETIGIDPTMMRAVDQDLYYKMEEQGEHLFLDEVLYLYRIHEKSISANKNEFKAKYWHFYATVKAFERRTKLDLKIDNFSNSEIKKIKSNYYLSRFEREKANKRICPKYYFLVKSIIAFPSHKTKFKIRSLIK